MHLLFSYGTLQKEAVQLATFGRVLNGQPDSLPAFEQSVMVIDDDEVVRTSGSSRHPIVRYTGVPDQIVPGTVFEVSDQELQHADRYEVAAYRRIAASLVSGRVAWVYVDVSAVPPGPVAPVAHQFGTT